MWFSLSVKRTIFLGALLLIIDCVKSLGLSGLYLLLRCLITFIEKIRGISRSLKIVAHVDKVHSVSTKLNLYRRTLDTLISLRHSN